MIDKLSEEREDWESDYNQDGESVTKEAGTWLRGRGNLNSDVGHSVVCQESSWGGCGWLVQVGHGDNEGTVLAASLIDSLFQAFAEGVLKLALDSILSLIKAAGEFLGEAEVFIVEFEVLPWLDATDNNV